MAEPAVGGPPAAGGPEQQLELPSLSIEESAALADRHGLREVGVRPPLRTYLEDTWAKRQFLWSMSSAESYAANQNNHLGQLWSVLNPLLLVASYFLIFGLLLNTRGGTGNYLGFLTIGIFLFSSTSSSLTRGCRAIIGNIALLRALQFPRCILPLSVSLTQLIASLPTFGILLLLMLVTGEQPSLEWVVFPVAILAHTLINAGIVLFAARIVNGSRDLANLVNMITRLLRYVSGVFFAIDHYTKGHEVVGAMMQYQPVSVSLTMSRQALLGESAIDATTWLVGIGWAVLLPVAGLIFFWRGEASYGRG